MARSIHVQILGDSSSLTRAFKQSSRSANIWNSDLSRASRGALVATVGFRGLGRSIAFASASFVGGAGLIAGIKASIEGFARFQEEMQRTVGLANVAQSQVAGFSRQILELAPKIGKGPQELSEAFFFIASSGIEASKAMSVLDAAAKGSIAGLGETKTVADALTSAINAYGIENLSAARAADVLAAAVREGKGEADQFAPVIGNVVALASQLNVEFEEVGAALAAQTRLGTSAEITAIQLQRVFSTLLKVTPQSRKGFEEVGLSVEQLREDLGEKGLLNVLTQVKGAFADNLPALSAAFGDVRALRGVLNLVGGQSEEVRVVFDRMANSAGSAKKAFDAVSKDTAQQFRRLKASAQVVGISVGAIVAPLAGRVASALADAASHVTDFFNDLGKATTTKGKLNVVFGAAVGLEKAVESGIREIDWKKVWARARGIGDGLQARLEKVDFGFIGRKVGDGIAAAVKVAIPAAKDLATRINQAMTEIDFVAFGKKAGPGLAAALVTAFVTLMDPAFWVKNWDLALAVAATVFRARIIGLAGKVIGPLRKFGGDAVLAITGGIERFAPRIANVLLKALLVLPKVAAQALTPLVRLVERIFNRIGRKTQFFIRVLGIQAAINAIVGFAQRVGSVLGGVVKTVGSFFSNLWNDIKKSAIRAALDIIEPFTHIPGFLGGGAFQNLKKEWQATLDRLESGAKTSTKNIQDNIDRLKGKEIEIKIKVSHISDAHSRPGGTVDKQKRKKTLGGKVTQDALDAIEQAAKARAEAATAAKEAAERAEKAKEASLKAFSALSDSLSLEADMAATTKSLQDDIAVQRKIQSAIRKQMQVEGQTTALRSQLFESQQKVAEFNKQIAERQRTERQKRQFLGLGLTAEGEERIPGRSALLKKTKTLREQIKGTVLDTPKTVRELTNIAKVLTGKFGKVGRDVREAIFQMLRDINDALDGGGKQGPLTKTTSLNTNKLLKDLDIDPDVVRELRGRLSNFNSAGRGFATGPQSAREGGFVSGPIVVESRTTINLDGQKVADVVTRQQQRQKRRNPKQKRGPNRRGI